mmetsp:Transcript_7091/g.12864  ORF Transcript_7091/g.12864 Transcript_7091/m.12864 type:complete len:85 (+) Transcript_7091:676-930(+)
MDINALFPRLLQWLLSSRSVLPCDLKVCPKRQCLFLSNVKLHKEGFVVALRCCPSPCSTFLYSGVQPSHKFEAAFQLNKAEAAL